MMVTFFTGSTFNQVISESIQEVGELIYRPCIEDDQDFLKYVKQNIVSMEGIDCLILDTSACINTDEEILSALEMIRTMYDRVRLIIFAPYKNTGDKFLADCLGMGITNIINTNDFNDVKKELMYCVREGMAYRDAVKYKECQTEKVQVNRAVRRAVHHRMIGVSGAESNIGTTHNAIVLANFFRKKGFRVALAESNKSGAFEAIRDAYEETKFEKGYFTVNGIDMYPDVDEKCMQTIQSQSYNVIIVDFGVFSEINKDAFERCEDKLVIAGAKPWEMDSLNGIFELASRDVIGKYIFCFNFTSKKDYKAIREGMKELSSVHFLKYLEEPFTEHDFSDGDEIFENILPEKNDDDKKKGFMEQLFKKGKHSEQKK